MYHIVAIDVIGVPITFLSKHNPEQFEIVGQLNVRCYMDDTGWHGACGIHNLLEIEGRTVYKRILIRKVK